MCGTVILFGVQGEDTPDDAPRRGWTNLHHIISNNTLVCKLCYISMCGTSACSSYTKRVIVVVVDFIVVPFEWEFSLIEF